MLRERLLGDSISSFFFNREAPARHKRGKRMATTKSTPKLADPTHGDTKPVVVDETTRILNRILHLELNGVMHGMQHRLLASWLRKARRRALNVGKLLVSRNSKARPLVNELVQDARLSESELLMAAIAREQPRLSAYRALLSQVPGRDPELEAFARARLAEDERFLAELAGMLHQPNGPTPSN